MFTSSKNSTNSAKLFVHYIHKCSEKPSSFLHDDVSEFVTDIPLYDYPPISTNLQCSNVDCARYVKSDARKMKFKRRKPKIVAKKLWNGLRLHFGPSILKKPQVILGDECCECTDEGFTEDSPSYEFSECSCKYEIQTDDEFLLVEYESVFNFSIFSISIVFTTEEITDFALTNILIHTGAETLVIFSPHTIGLPNEPEDDPLNSDNYFDMCDVDRDGFCLLEQLTNFQRLVMKLKFANYRQLSCILKDNNHLGSDFPFSITHAFHDISTLCDHQRNLFLSDLECRDFIDQRLIANRNFSKRVDSDLSVIGSRMCLDDFMQKPSNTSLRGITYQPLSYMFINESVFEDSQNIVNSTNSNRRNLINFDANDFNNHVMCPCRLRDSVNLKGDQVTLLDSLNQSISCRSKGKGNLGRIFSVCFSKSTKEKLPVVSYIPEQYLYNDEQSLHCTSPKIQRGMTFTSPSSPLTTIQNYQRSLSGKFSISSYIPAKYATLQSKFWSYIDSEHRIGAIGISSANKSFVLPSNIVPNLCLKRTLNVYFYACTVLTHMLSSETPEKLSPVQLYIGNCSPLFHKNERHRATQRRHFIEKAVISTNASRKNRENIPLFRKMEIAEPLAQCTVEVDRSNLTKASVNDKPLDYASRPWSYFPPAKLGKFAHSNNYSENEDSNRLSKFDARSEFKSKSVVDGLQLPSDVAQSDHNQKSSASTDTSIKRHPFGPTAKQPQQTITVIKDTEFDSPHAVNRKSSVSYASNQSPSARRLSRIRRRPSSTRKKTRERSRHDSDRSTSSSSSFSDSDPHSKRTQKRHSVRALLERYEKLTKELQQTSRSINRLCYNRKHSKDRRHQRQHSSGEEEMNALFDGVLPKRTESAVVRRYLESIQSKSSALRRGSTSDDVAAEPFNLSVQRGDTREHTTSKLRSMFDKHILHPNILNSQQMGHHIPQPQQFTLGTPAPNLVESVPGTFVQYPQVYSATLPQEPRWPTGFNSQLLQIPLLPATLTTLSSDPSASAGIKESTRPQSKRRISSRRHRKRSESPESRETCTSDRSTCHRRRTSHRFQSMDCHDLCSNHTIPVTPCGHYQPPSCHCAHASHCHSHIMPPLAPTPHVHHGWTVPKPFGIQHAPHCDFRSSTSPRFSGDLHNHFAHSSAYTCNNQNLPGAVQQMPFMKTSSNPPQSTYRPVPSHPISNSGYIPTNPSSPYRKSVPELAAGFQGHSIKRPTPPQDLHPNKFPGSSASPRMFAPRGSTHTFDDQPIHPAKDFANTESHELESKAYSRNAYASPQESPRIVTAIPVTCNQRMESVNDLLSQEPRTTGSTSPARPAQSVIAMRANLPSEPSTPEEWKQVENRFDRLQQEKSMLEGKLARRGTSAVPMTMVEEQHIKEYLSRVDKEMSALRLLMHRRFAEHRRLRAKQQ